jgi:hypothetical protein
MIFPDQPDNILNKLDMKKPFWNVPKIYCDWYRDGASPLGHNAVTNYIFMKMVVLQT